MFQVKCGDALLYNPLVNDEYMLEEPTVKLTTNGVDSFSFTIYPNHPSINKLQKMSSVVTIEQDGHYLFRGRIIDSEETFFKAQKIKCEGLLACANDTVIPPFKFPEDFTIPDGSNVIEVFLAWILDQHNNQVADYQKLYLGTITVTDPNNYITRSSESRMKTWKCLKEKLFNSSIGGKLFARYGTDGKTYIDYVNSFEYANTQNIEFGQNLVDLQRTVNGADLFTAVLPIGHEGLTIADLPDGDINSTITKRGEYVYHKQGIEKHGWIVADLDDSTFDDVTVAQNLRSKAVKMFIDDGIQLPTTITIKAVDLHLTDEEIGAIRCHQAVRVVSAPHGIDKTYELTDLEIPLFNPQDSEITLGETIKTLIDYSQQNKGDSSVDLSGYATKGELNKEINDVNVQLNTTDSRLSQQITDIISRADSIIQRVGSIESDYTTSEELKTELQQTASNFKVSVDSLKESLENIDGETRKKFEKYETFFDFTSDGLIIGKEGSPILLHMTGGENAVIEFLLNGVAVLSIDKNGMVAETNIIHRVIHIGEFTLTAVSERLLTLT